MVQKNTLNKLLIICGATATGKSDLAVECAKILDSEVISADSMNVYKGLDIGTAKPSEEEKQGIVHHLIDVVSPYERYTVGDYRAQALPILKNLLERGKIPVICGGTGFYINSLLYNLSYGNGLGDLTIRDKYKKIAEEYGNEKVFDVLKEYDPETAEKLHPNDLKRVIRALEIYESGTKKSDITDDMTPLFDYSAYSFDFPRETLHARIDKRVDKMIETGLIEEVIGLKKAGVRFTDQCMQGIGYKEIYDYLKGNSSFENAVSTIKLNTRHYAKRQITFFKKLPGLIYLTPGNLTETAQRICEKL